MGATSGRQGRCGDAQKGSQEAPQQTPLRRRGPWDARGHIPRGTRPPRGRGQAQGGRPQAVEQGLPEVVLGSGGTLGCTQASPGDLTAAIGRDTRNTRLLGYGTVLIADTQIEPRLAVLAELIGSAAEIRRIAAPQPATTSAEPEVIRHAPRVCLRFTKDTILRAPVAASTNIFTTTAAAPASGQGEVVPGKDSGIHAEDPMHGFGRGIGGCCRGPGVQGRPQ